MNQDKVKLYAASPYPEAAFTSIVSQAMRSEILAQSFLPPNLFKSITKKAATELAPGDQRSPSLICQGATAVLESGRLAARASGVHSAQKHWMYLTARTFDRLAAADLPIRPLVILGMPGASKRLFIKGARRGHRCVFHAVNAHPSFHNDVLIATYGASRVAEELIPDWMVRRQVEELRLATTVLVPSRAVERQMHAAGVPSDKVLRIPYGVDLTFFNSAPVADDHRAEGPVRVLFVGQISYRKGIPFLLSAARDQELEVTLVGPMVSKSALDNMPRNVTYLGIKSRAEVRELMFEHDAFVLPSVEDACALVIAEAAASGLPVITTTANGASELLKPPHCSTVPPADAVALGVALGSVKPLLPQNRSELARQIRSADQFQVIDWNAYAKRVLDSLLT